MASFNWRDCARLTQMEEVAIVLASETFKMLQMLADYKFKTHFRGWKCVSSKSGRPTAVGLEALIVILWSMNFPYNALFQINV